MPTLVEMMDNVENEITRINSALKPLLLSTHFNKTSATPVLALEELRDQCRKIIKIYNKCLANKVSVEDTKALIKPMYKTLLDHKECRIGGVGDYGLPPAKRARSHSLRF